MIITATTNSNLYNIRLYGDNTSLHDIYPSANTITENGVDFNLSILTGSTIEIVYYIDGFKYVDFSGETNQTIVEYESLGYTDSNNFDYGLPIKNESIQNVIAKPKTKSDVNIIRQSLSVFDKIYRLESINKLSDLVFYAGGTVFNIENNI